jgi:hypothetical protein
VPPVPPEPPDDELDVAAGRRGASAIDTELVTPFCREESCSIRPGEDDETAEAR